MARICVVEVKGGNLAASCATPVVGGMVVETDTEKVNKARRLAIELLLASGNHNCTTCEANGDCQLQDLAYQHGMVWMDFHFREGCANWLTNPAYNPETYTAEYKACAVNIEKL